MHPTGLHLKDDDRVYVIGDAVGQVAPTFRFYPKAGHVAHAHGVIVAGYLSERLAGRSPKHQLPDNLCYMMVNPNPREAISQSRFGSLTLPVMISTVSPLTGG